MRRTLRPRDRIIKAKADGGDTTTNREPPFWWLPVKFPARVEGVGTEAAEDFTLSQEVCHATNDCPILYMHK